MSHEELFGILAKPCPATLAGRADAAGDSHFRTKTGPDTFACGCRWERQPGIGDVLKTCAEHRPPLPGAKEGE